MQEELDQLMALLGAWGYAGLGLAAIVEYVFPPFPGDTVALLGGAWAVRDERSIILVHLVLTLGSALGIAITWRVGRALGSRISHAPEGTRLLGLEVAQIHRAQRLMRERGDWVLLSNRFLPTFRSVLFVAAGAAEVPLWRALALGLLSAAVFNGILLGVGVVVGVNAEAIGSFFHQFRVASLTGLGVVLTLVVVRFLWQRRRAKSRS